MFSRFAAHIGRRPLLAFWVIGRALWFLGLGVQIRASASDIPANPNRAVPLPVAAHWAFQSVRPPSLPTTVQGHWIENPIDAFVLAKLEENKMSPASRADRRALLRRATYDLIGLPPTPEEMDRFLADDSPSAFAHVVDRLLASPAYGERWGRHWLDVVRYADARDLIQLPAESDFREAWRYRDWVIQAHNRDLPYTEFIRHQIAGDLLQPPDREQIDTNALIATGLLAIADFVPGDVDKDLMIADYVNDQIDVVGRAFLGLTFGCARCHDHKFDPISIEDYYGLAGIFFSTRLIPSPVLGNTPLVRVPLVPRGELDRIAARKARIETIDKALPALRLEADKEYLSQIERLVTETTAQYLLASWEIQRRAPDAPEISLSDFARSRGLQSKILSRWLDYFGLRDYRLLDTLVRNEGSLPGLHRWSSGTNLVPAARVNNRSEPVERLGVLFPPRSVTLTSSSNTSAVMSWTSPFTGKVRLAGRIGDLTGTGSKGLSLILDLRTPVGRRELARISVPPSGSKLLDTIPEHDHLRALEVRAGDSLELGVEPQAGTAPTALIEWTIAELGSSRVWATLQDLTDEPSGAGSSGWHADRHGNRNVWSFRETADVPRPGVEPARWTGAWSAWRETLQTRAEKPADRSIVESQAREMQRLFADASRQQAVSNHLGSAQSSPLLPSEWLRLRAGDGRLLNSVDGRVGLWPNRARSTAPFATVPSDSIGPFKTNITLAGRSRPVLRFAGKELMEIALTVPSGGSLFAVFRVADLAASGQRLIGWEDSNGGRHGIGLMPTAGGGLHAVLRKEGANGDIVAPPLTNTHFQVVSLVWGSSGATLHREGVATGKSTALDGLSSDPNIKALRIGGPGSGSAAKFQGDLAELRVYGQPLDDHARLRVEKELFDAWLSADGPGPAAATDLALAFDELCSPRSPFWLDASEREARTSSELLSRIAEMEREMGSLKSSIPTNLPQAVVVQEGGPAKTQHEGFKDAHVYLRGNHKNPGKIVPRGFPKALAGDHQPPIDAGSGRLPLANWIASANNPLTARVAVNRIWQHHFGEGLVRTSTNFGKRGERPTHPELLDYLASCFVESGWSMKAMHRLIMLSAVYQQSSHASTEMLAADPENRLWGRMNRTRLEAEALRDSLLVVAGRLDRSQGGPGFQEMGLPRRSVYLMSVRTGAKSGFASVFDAPDCGAIVERRSITTVAPQALFFLNDPFSTEQARELARRVVQEWPNSGSETWIRSVYRLVFGRSPTVEEVAIGLELLLGTNVTERFERYCQLLICSNEFVYLD